jgi:hypothetical protein
MVALWCVHVAPIHAAEAGEERDQLPEAGWELAPYVAVARHSPVGTNWGVTPDRDHLFLGVHAAFAVLKRPRWTLAYAPDVVPLLLVTNNPTYRTVALPAGKRMVVEDGRGPVAGFAVAPIGVEARVAASARWRLYAGGALGAVWFTRDVPILDARAFNYTFEFGGGVHWQYRRGQALRVGYKFHHLSNMYTARQNPGVDGHLFLIGVARAIGK